MVAQPIARQHSPWAGLVPGLLAHPTAIAKWFLVSTKKSSPSNGAALRGGIIFRFVEKQACETA